MHLVEKTFTLDPLSENDAPIKYKGYLDLKNPLWNGWANPYFTEDVRNQFITDEEKFLGNMQEEKELIEELKLIEPNYDSYGNKLYFFGGFICWDMVEDFTKDEIKTIKQFREER